jgi:hypothetical protein
VVALQSFKEPESWQLSFEAAALHGVFVLGDQDLIVVVPRGPPRYAP